MPGLLAGILFLSILLTAPAHARYIYVYQDDAGKVHYSDYLSAVPPQYRSKARAQFVPDKKPKAVDKEKAAKNGDAKTSAAGPSKDEKAGLTKQQEQLMKESRAVLNRMVPLEARYRDVPKDYTNGRRMYNDIQSNLPIKESLVEKLSGAKQPLLQKVRGFVQSSIKIDRNTAVTVALPQHIFAIYKRFTDETKQAQSLIEQIDRAIEKSKKDKAEAEAKAQREAEKKKQK
jgi:hypothetical protein